MSRGIITLTYSTQEGHHSDMGRVTLEIEGYICERCEHTWIPRQEGAPPPRVCPKCKSPYWDVPRKAKKTTKK